MHVRLNFANLTPLDLRPHHERVHRPFYVVRVVLLRLQKFKNTTTINSSFLVTFFGKHSICIISKNQTDFYKNFNEIFQVDSDLNFTIICKLDDRKTTNFQRISVILTKRWTLETPGVVTCRSFRLHGTGRWKIVKQNWQRGNISLTTFYQT